MISGEFKNLLLEVFEVLGFSEEEKNKALATFKKKVASGVLNNLKEDLSLEHQEWINGQSMSMDQGDPVIAEIQEEIKSKNSDEELYQKSKLAFKDILSEYINFMSADLEPEKVVKLNNILANV